MHWLNGKTYKTDEIPFNANDRGLLLGDGIFDTSLALNGRIFLREAHLTRLLNSCAALGIAIDKAFLNQGLDTVLARNNDAALRITVTRGIGPRGLIPPDKAKPNILISSHPLARDKMFAPTTLWCSTIRRNETSFTSRHKTLNYIDAVQGQREAGANGADEALFLNTQDRVACTGTGNIFALIDGKLITPPTVDGVLPGTVRNFLLHNASKKKITVQEKSLSLGEILEADLVFITNSLRLVSPVTSIGETQYMHAGHNVFRSVKSLTEDAIREECGVDRGLGVVN